MPFAKLCFLIGIALLGSSAVGLTGAGVMGVAAVVLLIGAATAATAMEARDAVDGLVVHQLTSEPDATSEPVAPPTATAA
jgi:hypothetical protein